MQGLAVALTCLLTAAGAATEAYRVLEGSLTSSETGETVALTGALEASLFELDDPAPPTVLLVDDFELNAGERSFTPRGIIEFDGLRPSLFLSFADQIQVDGGSVGFLRLHAGGLLSATDEDVTFRTFEFRADASDGGRAVGQIGDGPFPRRLDLEGTLFQVDQTFLLPSDDCPPPTDPQPGDGGVVIISDPIIDDESSDLLPGEIAAFVLVPILPTIYLPLPGDVTVVSEEPPTAGEGPPGAAGPFGLPDRLADLTPEQLGISGPAEIVVSVDESGALTIASEGDLVIAGTEWDLPGVTSIHIATPGSITIEGTLVIPPDVPLHIDAGGTISGGIDNGGGPPGEEVPPVLPPPFPFPIACEFLRPLPPEEREVGSFSIVATAAQPVEIDVLPWRHPNRVRPGSRIPIPVALLGSRALDVRDIDPASLRLGPGEAPPLIRRGIHVRANRDRLPDLLTLFRARDAEIAFGDTLVCLTGQTRDGTLIEGCDRIQTAPARRPAPLRRRR